MEKEKDVKLSAKEQRLCICDRVAFSSTIENWSKSWVVITKVLYLFFSCIKKTVICLYS